MSDYRLLSDGTPTTADDPQRGIWYSAGSMCGYWTDDWSKLDARGGIPCCPVCKCPSMQIEAEKWFAVPAEFAAKHPQYEEWLPTSREKCGVKARETFIDRYKRETAQAAGGDDECKQTGMP